MLRFEIIRAVFRKELTEALRDRRSLAVMFGIPLLLYPLLTLAISNLTMGKQQRMQEKVYAVAVVGGEGAPQLVEQLRAEKSGLKVVAAEDARGALAEGKVDAVVEISEGLQERALAAEEVEVRVRLDRSRTDSQVVGNNVRDAVERFEKWVLDQRLAARELPGTLLRGVGVETDDIATGGQRLGKVLGLALPNILLFTGMLGALFPAINAMTTEREAGTFEALLITPAKKMELLLAKGALVLLASLFTAAINLVSMSLVLWRVVSLTGREGNLEISYGALGLTFLAALPALIFFSALTMLVGLFARSFREANSYATPVMLIPLVSMGVSIAEPAISPGLLVTPVVNTTLIIREVLTGRVGADAFLIAFVSSCIYAGLMLSFAARMFTSESLVNPSWEPLSLKGLKFGGKRGARRLPAIDEAVVLFVVVLLLLFYVSPSWTHLGLMPTLAGNELLLITLPAVLFAWIGRYDVRDTFSFRRAPALAYVGAAMMGVGMALFIGLLSYLQRKFWAPDPQQAKQVAELIVPSLLNRPVLTILGVGLLAGVCEEILFRGPIQRAMAKRWRMWPTLLSSGFLFAALHMDLHGLPIRMLISVFLGWLVWRGRSIFPAMLMHGVYDSTQLFQAWWAVRGKSVAEVMGMEDALPAGFWVRVVVGLAVLVAGWVLCAGVFKRWKGEETQEAEEARGFEVVP